MKARLWSSAPSLVLAMSVLEGTGKLSLKTMNKHGAGSAVVNTKLQCTLRTAHITKGSILCFIASNTKLVWLWAASCSRPKALASCSVMLPTDVHISIKQSPFFQMCWLLSLLPVHCNCNAYIGLPNETDLHSGSRGGLLFGVWVQVGQGCV